MLSYFLLYLDRAADDYPAVKNHGQGGCDCDAMISSKLSFLCSTHLGASYFFLKQQYTDGGISVEN